MNSRNNSKIFSMSGKSTSQRRRKRKNCRSAVRNFDHCLNSDEDYGESNCIYDRTVPIWYWCNYFKAVEWQNKHKAVLSKCCAPAFQDENRNIARKLHECPDQVFNAHITLPNLKFANKMPCTIHNAMNNVENDTEMETDNSRSDEIEFELSGEMIKFFEQSIKHKLEMKRLKEEKEEIYTNDVELSLEAENQREKEMKLLYGDNRSMIIGMETAIQLGFDKYCYLKNPKYWPNIPLNI